MIPSIPCFLILAGQSTIPAEEPDTIYVSTIGSKLYLNADVALSDFVLWKISNADEAREASATVRRSTATGSIQCQMMCNLLLRQISVRDYSAETCYMVFSPRTRAQQIAQPYRLKDSTRLIFAVTTSVHKDSNDYSSVRVYVIPKEQDHAELSIRLGTTFLPLHQAKPTF